jgi:hypothetical protein
MVRSASRRHREQSHTSWGCADIVKWSSRFQGSVGDDNILPEDAQTLSNGQVGFTEASRKITYQLRMRRHCQMVRSALWRHRELSRTSWGCADIVKWSGRLHGGIENDHVQAEHAQTLSNGQDGFTEASRTITYKLSMRRYCQIVRSASRRHREQSHTSWGCADIVKWSGRLRGSVGNDNVHAEDAHTLSNGHVSLMQSCILIPYHLSIKTYINLFTSSTEARTTTYMLHWYVEFSDHQPNYLPRPDIRRTF